jgi:hypothetical protein
MADRREFLLSTACHRWKQADFALASDRNEHRAVNQICS